MATTGPFRRKVEYRLVSERVEDKDLFVKQVQKYLNAGWKPCGGLATGASYLFQAVTRTRAVGHKTLFRIKLPHRGESTATSDPTTPEGKDTV